MINSFTYAYDIDSQTKAISLRQYTHVFVEVQINIHTIRNVSYNINNL